jgi:hypothetical protein
MKKKIDFKKEYKFLFAASANEPQLVDVPAFKYLMVDGRGDPNSAPEFAAKTQALYGLAYTMKFMLKEDKKAALEYVVPPLSGLWCAYVVHWRIFASNTVKHQGPAPVS